MFTIKCHLCNLILTKKQNQSKSGINFCTKKHYREWQKTRIKNINCDWCKKPMQRNLARIEKVENSFCSNECQWDWRHSNKTFHGKNHPAWTGGSDSYRGPNWNDQSKKARIRDNNECRECSGAADAVHHLVPFRVFTNYMEANNLTNLITLCNSCHGKADALFRKIYPLVGNNIENKINCVWCDKLFLPEKRSNTVCCHKRNCLTCGIEFYARLNDRVRCSNMCRIAWLRAA